ncbi:hypothetical protein FB45DRAFT_935866 [Roridomyces roridus]|uniref:F-box domain-containing protein n=1 Tax=Roridomyces roridus TaxID=1738132 RepID=A0AAD7BAE4_9AGAR|nr:hypothetical protein FB45DRAFT_935866 [Roridomyces roridus]
MPLPTLASPFATRLGTNYCPTDEEIIAIESFLIGPSLRVNVLDDEIAALHQRLSTLQDERDGLVTHVEAHRALISPVRRLPLDIIQETFVACLPDRNCVMSATEAPVLLGRVCSSWRSISLSNPRLWSKLHIVEPCNVTQASGNEKWAQRMETAAAWLAEHIPALLPDPDTPRLALACGPFRHAFQHNQALVGPHRGRCPRPPAGLYIRATEHRGRRSCTVGIYQHAA